MQLEWIDESIKALRAKAEEYYKETGEDYTDQFGEVEEDFKAEFDRLMSFYLFPNETLMEEAFKSDVF